MGVIADLKRSWAGNSTLTKLLLVLAVVIFILEVIGVAFKEGIVWTAFVAMRDAGDVPNTDDEPTPSKVLSVARAAKADAAGNEAAIEQIGERIEHVNDRIGRLESRQL